MRQTILAIEGGVDSGDGGVPEVGGKLDGKMARLVVVVPIVVLVFVTMLVTLFVPIKISGVGPEVLVIVDGKIELILL